MGHYRCRGTMAWGSWHARRVVPRAVARIMAWVTCPSTASSTISRVIVAIVAREVARVMCLGSARGHQARPHGTRRVSWLGSRAPSKAPWHLGLARGRAPCKASCHLGLARGHQARPRGMHRVSWLGSRAGTTQEDSYAKSDDSTSNYLLDNGDDYEDILPPIRKLK